ncbi:hypothetical protein DL98DRAFT_172258 [Cadophora sp. DSE1049]|nr:hypothetical protein DL98DRAFT_172258 [Cadophora sp. DSE1049]
MPPKTRRRAAKSPQRNDSKHKISRSSRQGLRSTMRSDPKLEDEPSIQTAASSATPRIGFLSVPIEIRDMIYRLLLTKDDPVCIRSSSMRNPHIARPVNHTTSIVRVNRQISDEALPILYSSQPFEFSDGTRSRVTDADILKSFLATLRPHLIASITSMNLTACLRMGYAANMLGHYYLMSGDLNYASNFREMCQQMLKNMKGLRSVTIDFGPWGNSIHALRLLSRTATVSGLAGSVRMLMKLPKLKQMKLIDNNIDGFSLLLEKIVSDKLVPERTVRCTVVPSSITDPHPPGLLRTNYLLSW